LAPPPLSTRPTVCALSRANNDNNVIIRYVQVLLSIETLVTSTNVYKKKALKYFQRPFSYKMSIMSDKVYAAAYECGQGFTLKHSVLQQCQVYQLMYNLVAGCILAVDG